MAEEACRETSFSRGGAALRQVTRLEGLQDLPVPRPGCPGWALLTQRHGGPVQQTGWEGWPSLGRWVQDGCSEEVSPQRRHGKGGQPPPGAGGFGGAAGKQEAGKGVLEAGETPAGLQLCCHRAARVSGSQQCPARTRGPSSQGWLVPCPRADLVPRCSVLRGRRAQRGLRLCPPASVAVLPAAGQPGGAGDQQGAANSCPARLSTASQGFPWAPMASLTGASGTVRRTTPQEE